MASQFYLVHHHIKPNMSEAWWGIVGGQTEEDSKEYENRSWKKDFSTILSCQWDQTDRCTFGSKDGISASEFQDFIDGPDGVNFGLQP